VTDMPAAMELAGLGSADFLKACKLSMPKLADAYARARGVPKATASREIEGALAGLIVEGPPSVSLVEDKGACA